MHEQTARSSRPASPDESRTSDPRDTTPRRSRGSSWRPVALVTGGAGFIGTNVTRALIERGYNVRILDNLSRPGVSGNLRWLQRNFGERLEVVVEDVSHFDAVHQAVAGVSRVYHFAAQVAVTTSLLRPIDDFEINVRGTLNVLEACRQQPEPPRLLFTSTNKVYGSLPHVPLIPDGEQYGPANTTLQLTGIDERQPLDFHSPYGCSKGAADQYVLDYARCYGLPNAVFRMSCIYGPHQHGTEDQGWVAHFARSVLADREVVFYGDGRQVRDLLYVEDLAAAMLQATDHIERTRGRAYNVGGGVQNTASLQQVVQQLSTLSGRIIRIRYEDWRPGDQRYYVSDIRQLCNDTGWHPRVSVTNGLRKLYEWLATETQATSLANEPGGYSLATREPVPS